MYRSENQVADLYELNPVTLTVGTTNVKEFRFTVSTITDPLLYGYMVQHTERQAGIEMAFSNVYHLDSR